MVIFSFRGIFYRSVRFLGFREEGNGVGADGRFVFLVCLLSGILGR